MNVERTHAGHQTRYELRDQDRLSCALTYTSTDNPVSYGCFGQLTAMSEGCWPSGVTWMVM
jgi:hypothetical protein